MSDYIRAYNLFIAGRIPVMQAVAMVACDQRWCKEMGYREGSASARDYAAAVVLTQWRAELVARIQRDKVAA